MKGLLEFLSESIGYSQLSGIVEFVKIEIYEASDIIKEHNGEKELGYFNNDPYTMLLFGEPDTAHYKVMVNGTCVGVFSCINGKDIYEQSTEADYFEAMVMPWAMERNRDKENAHIKRDVYRDIADEIVYVPYLFMFKEEKISADLSPTAAIKVVFDKIKSIAKSNRAKYILAVGKDDRVTRLYQVVGGFKKITDYPGYIDYLYTAPYPVHDPEFYKDVSKHTVYYKL